MIESEKTLLKMKQCCCCENVNVKVKDIISLISLDIEYGVYYEHSNNRVTKEKIYKKDAIATGIAIDKRDNELRIYVKR